MPLIEKLSRIMKEVGRVEKRGRNTFHNYDYVMEADLVEAIRGPLSEAGIICIPAVDKVTLDKLDKGVMATVEVTYTFRDGNESVIVRSAGSGTDIPGDKAIFKALTGALKYALRQFFLIPTGDDPERDSDSNNGPGHKRDDVQRGSDSQREDTRREDRPSPTPSKVSGIPSIKFGKGRGKTLAEASEQELAEWTKTMETAVSKNDPKWHKSNERALAECQAEWNKRSPWREAWREVLRFAEESFSMDEEAVADLLKAEFGLAKADQMKQEDVQKYKERIFEKVGENEEA